MLSKKYFIGFLFVAFFLQISCRPNIGQKKISMEKDVMTKNIIQEVLSNSHNCFLYNTAYCLDDPLLIESLINQVIQKRFKGKFPETEAEFKKLSRAVSIIFSVEQYQTQERRDVIEKKIESNYQKPSIEENGNVLTVKLGLLPGKLEVYKGTIYRVFSSHQTINGEWKASEAARYFQKYKNEHPQKLVFDLFIKVPTGTLITNWLYKYVVPQDRILVYRQDQSNTVYATPKLDGRFDLLFKDDTFLNTSKLKKCTLKSAAFDMDQDCLSIVTGGPISYP